MGIIETIKMLTREEALEEGIVVGLEKGIEKGSENKSYEVVTNLLMKKFSIPEIADIANVSEAFVKKIQMELGL